MAAPALTTITYAPRGASRALFSARDSEVVLSGPAGTGKSRSVLEKIHLMAAKYPDARFLIVRKTLQSLKSSTLVTFDEKVQPQLDGVAFHGDTGKRPAHYAYPNGSVIVIGGMDRPTKVLSSEYDVIYVPECTELTENDWETLTTRLRNGKMPYQQMLGDCNPDAPSHWMRQRMDAGKTRELISVHADNPMLWDGRGDLEWTAEGIRYMAVLDALSGVRHARLRLGHWAAAEGMVYEDSWDRSKNLVDRVTISKRPRDLYGDCGIPHEWPRYLGIDFGFTHPFVCRWYAEDDDGRLWMYREIYMTHKLVEDHAADIKRYSRWGASDESDPLPRAIICDHDAEGRATLERHLGMRTRAAEKTVLEGIQLVAARFRLAGDQRPRLIYLRDSCVQRDQTLADAKFPTCGEEEVESYIWELRGNGKRGEAPVKEFDHAMDCDRYVVAFRDMGHRVAKYGAKLM